MKHRIGILTAIIISFCATSISAQDSPKEHHRVYAELLGDYTNFFGFNKNVNVMVDLGQYQSTWRYYKLMDEKGKNIKFNSMVDAMNYMGERGWVLVQPYITDKVCHWVMYKDITDKSQITDGLYVRHYIEPPKGDENFYVTYLKRRVTDDSWDLEKEEHLKNITLNEMQEIMNNWRNRSNDIYEYELIVKREKAIKE